MILRRTENPFCMQQRAGTRPALPCVRHARAPARAAPRAAARRAGAAAAQPGQVQLGGACYVDMADQLAARVAGAAAGREGKYIVGVAGAPGSGKSTLAQLLCRRVNELLAEQRGAAAPPPAAPLCAVVPMDGFHYYRRQLDAMPDPQEAHARRGAHWTFDAAAFVACVRRIRDEGSALVPSFDHGVGDPVENDIRVETGTRVVIVEGNYLYLEEEPWRQLRPLFDEAVFVDCPVDVAMRRVFERQARWWFVALGLAPEVSQGRIAGNDRPNAELVAATAGAACVLVPSVVPLCGGGGGGSGGDGFGSRSSGSATKGALGRGLSHTVGAPLSEWAAWEEDGAAADGGGGAAAAAAGTDAPESAAVQFELLEKLHGFQQQLALVSNEPLLGLPEAAELVAAHFGAAAAAIWVFTETDAGPAASLLASHGAAAGALAAAPAARRGDAEEMVGRATHSSLLQESAWRRQGSPAALPRCLRRLLEPAGLASFLYVPVGPAPAPLGALLIASRDPGAFADEWLQVRLQAAAMGLLHLVREPQVAAMGRLLADLDAAPDAPALVATLLEGAATFMLGATGTCMAARLALIHGAPRGGAPGALLAELPPAALGGAAAWRALKGPRGGAPGAAAAATAAAAAALLVSPLDVEGTLLASAVALAEARFITDCSKYIQAIPSAARDVFSRTPWPLGALVVVPLIGPGGTALGGLYFTVDAAYRFQDIRDTLLGFVRGVSGLLHARLAGPRRWEAAAALLAAPRGPSLEPTCSGLRFDTASMVKALQQEIRRDRGRPSVAGLVQELAVGEVVGHGAFGVVHRGFWNKAAAAIKIMTPREDEQGAISDAIEMAVLSSVQHPNIVAVYACLTDMVEVPEADVELYVGSCAAGSSNGTSGPLSRCTSGVSASASASGIASSLDAAPGAGPCGRFRRLQPDEEPGVGQEACSVLVMEYCDRGTLRDVIASGALAAPGGGAGGAGAAAALEVLLDVAYAVQYLHSMGLVHGNIKMDNVLMKSDAARRLQLAPKLADFGLTKILGDACQAPNVTVGGTLTHLAPELLEAGGAVTTAVDAYAFGVVMWELWTGLKAYAGLPSDVIAQGVLRHGLRPSFPPAAPPAYVALASACWAPKAGARPAFYDIAARLEAILGDCAPPEALHGPAPPAAARGGGGAAAALPRGEDVPDTGSAALAAAGNLRRRARPARRRRGAARRGAREGVDRGGGGRGGGSGGGGGGGGGGGAAGPLGSLL
ncbi:MAG: hypothetical protein J3K34DRAFT_521810 [Monoraphidium minutum]|nr:MAG: hypothetical protein J3K34DRAFT_521810 [Monoraphidium minutum]